METIIVEFWNYFFLWTLWIISSVLLALFFKFYLYEYLYTKIVFLYYSWRVKKISKQITDKNLKEILEQTI